MNSLVIENASFQHRSERPLKTVNYNPVTGKTSEGQFLPGDNVKVSVLMSKIDTLETGYENCLINKAWSELVDGMSVKVYQADGGDISMLDKEAVYDGENDKLIMTVSEQLTVEFTNAAAVTALIFDNAVILSA